MSARSHQIHSPETRFTILGPGLVVLRGSKGRRSQTLARSHQLIHIVTKRLVVQADELEAVLSKTHL